MNKYDLEHVTTGHRAMSAADWQGVYRKAWDLYYSPEHIETILRRAKASGIKPVRLLNHVLQFYFTFIQENVHPLQGRLLPAQIAAAAPGRIAAREPAGLLSSPGPRGRRDPRQAGHFLSAPAPHPPPRRARPRPLPRSGVDPDRRRSADPRPGPEGLGRRCRLNRFLHPTRNLNSPRNRTARHADDGAQPALLNPDRTQHCLWVYDKGPVRHDFEGSVAREAMHDELWPDF